MKVLFLWWESVKQNAYLIYLPFKHMIEMSKNAVARGQFHKFRMHLTGVCFWRLLFYWNKQVCTSVKRTEVSVYVPLDNTSMQGDNL